MTAYTGAAPFLLYFGCWDRPGHYIWTRDKRTVYAHEVSSLALRAEDLDGSTIFLPRPERPGHGQLTHLFRDGEPITVLAWWDRTFDQRGACNAAIQCDGWERMPRLWERFGRVYSTLAPKLTIPTLGSPSPQEGNR